MARIVIGVVLAAAAVAACAGPTRSRDAVGEVTIGGFVYETPGEGWRGVQHPPSAAGLVHHGYRRDGDRLQFQLSEIEPIRPVLDEAALVAWATQASDGRVELAAGHGATCARYAHRWRQTLSLGGPPQPWATIEERGLFCIDPLDSNRLLQVRVLERLAPEASASGDLDPLAVRLLDGVTARRAY